MRGVTSEQMWAEAPSLAEGESQRLQAALKQLMRTRKYQLFCDTPDPDAVYATGDEGRPCPAPGLFSASEQSLTSSARWLLGERPCIWV